MKKLILFALLASVVEEYSPMKRGLKEWTDQLGTTRVHVVEEYSPMKRGLKGKDKIIVLPTRRR
jgi:molybdopterin converting factor small subunit